MNERIKKLVKQAGLTFVNSITDDNEDIECVADTNGGLPCSTELEKFAELIVRECAELATKEYNNRSSIHGNDLLEHFGVADPDPYSDIEFSEEYDAYYYISKNEWIESVCDSPTCEFCSDRPERPLP